METASAEQTRANKACGDEAAWTECTKNLGAFGLRFFIPCMADACGSYIGFPKKIAKQDFLGRGAAAVK